MYPTSRSLCTILLALCFVVAMPALAQERDTKQDRSRQGQSMDQQDQQNQQDQYHQKKDKSKSSDMSPGKVTPRGMATRYIIVTEHTEAECADMMDKMAVDNQKALNNTWFGCMNGDHTGYTIVDAKDEKTAINMIPTEERGDAKVVKVNKFTPEMIKSMHKSDKSQDSR